ncbi:MAG: DUF1559 domain-containing protein [Planctomycetaceae bacterium]
MKFLNIRILGVVIVVAVLGVLVYPQYVKMRTAKRREVVKSHLKQIGVALHAYHDDYKCFPPAHMRGPDGERWHSWRVLLLPYLDEQELYDQYNFNEPWDGPHNEKLLAEMPRVFQDRWKARESTIETSIMAIVGQRTIWPGDQSLQFRDIIDGTSNTLMLLEVDEHAVPWTSPNDLSPRIIIEHFRDSSIGTHTVLADGSVHMLSSSIDEQLLRLLLTPTSGRVTYQGEWPMDLREEVQWKAVADEQDVATIAGVDITPVQATPIDAHQSLLWCVTFQLAWDALRDEFQVTEFNSTNPTARLLNQSSGTGVLSQGQASITVTRETDQGQPRISMHAALVKQMPYETSFTRLDPRLFRFQKPQQVNMFGNLPAAGGLGDPCFESQVTIVDYVSDDDFILKLTAQTEQHDEIYIAFTETPPDLESGWIDIAMREQSPNKWHDRPYLMTGDRLEIPVLDFHFKKQFRKLTEGKTTNLPLDYEFDEASQSIYFSLDENGAELISEADIGVIGEFGDDSPPTPPPVLPRAFVVDRPFLVAVKESNADRPYLLMWVASPALMDAD